MLLLPLPEALMISGGAVSVGGGVGGRRYKKQSAPLAPFDKFMRTSKNVRAPTALDVFIGGRYGGRYGGQHPRPSPPQSARMEGRGEACSVLYLICAKIVVLLSFRALRFASRRTSLRKREREIYSTTATLTINWIVSRQVFLSM